MGGPNHQLGTNRLNWVLLSFFRALFFIFTNKQSAKSNTNFYLVKDSDWGPLTSSSYWEVT